MKTLTKDEIKIREKRNKLFSKFHDLSILRLCLVLITNDYQSLVSCGGRRRPVNGLRQQHVHTIRLLVWYTLEDFTAIMTSYVGRRR